MVLNILAAWKFLVISVYLCFDCLLHSGLLTGNKVVLLIEISE